MKERNQRENTENCNEYQGLCSSTSIERHCEHLPQNFLPPDISTALDITGYACQIT